MLDVLSETCCGVGVALTLILGGNKYDSPYKKRLCEICSTTRSDDGRRAPVVEVVTPTSLLMEVRGAEFGVRETDTYILFSSVAKHARAR